MTKEDLEEAGGRGDREDWLEEEGCPETRQEEGWSARNCRRNGVNLAISVKGTTPVKTESLLEGTFIDEFRTPTILLLVILATDGRRSHRPFFASDIIFCLGIVFCKTAKFEPNAQTMVSVSVS